MSDVKKYYLGQKVICLGCLEGLVTAVMLRAEGATYEFSYVADGTVLTQWVGAYELAETPKKSLGFGVGKEKA